MVTKKDVLESLKQINTPEKDTNIVDHGLVKDVEIEGDRVRVVIALSNSTCAQVNALKRDVESALFKLQGLCSVDVQLTYLPTVGRRGIHVSRSELTGAELKGRIGKLPKKEIKHIIAVTSGKSAIERPIISALLAMELVKQGFYAGILDADFTTPSMASLFGVEKAEVDVYGIHPVTSKTGVSVISTDLLTKLDEKSLYWRAPVTNKVVTLLYQQVRWGKLDYLFIDLPSGNIDVFLTVLQRFPLDGVLIVSSVFDANVNAVKRVVEIAKERNIMILGLIEGRSQLSCPHCNNKIEQRAPIGEEITESGVPFLGVVPIDYGTPPIYSARKIEEFTTPAISEIAKRLTEKLAESR